mgnify:CR=1 FL=1|tara:strand:+ start:417 stop:914 length:498 start_codon:yes stop_codon:yes gene_type:complete
MNAKHQFKYTYNDTNLEEFSPVDVTFDMPGDVTINQMLYNFESYLKACGFYFDGHLEVVQEESYDELNVSDELDGTLYEFDEEPAGGCMADFDKECGCETTSSPVEKWKEYEVVKNNWVHGMCNPPADDAKEYVKDCKSTDKKYNSVDALLKDLMKKRSKDSQLY